MYYGELTYEFIEQTQGYTLENFFSELYISFALCWSYAIFCNKQPLVLLSTHTTSNKRFGDSVMSDFDPVFKTGTSINIMSESNEVKFPNVVWGEVWRLRHLL